MFLRLRPSGIWPPRAMGRTLSAPGLATNFWTPLRSPSVSWSAIQNSTASTNYRSFRRVLLQRFPYKVFYQIIGERVVIFRVLDAKQEHGRKL